MPKYTYKDIIIDPTSDEAKACIGKKVYYASNPNEVLRRANNNNIFTLDTLLNIYSKDIYPFIVDNSALTSDFPCIILKKEESKPEPEYVPFDNIGEFIEANLEHNKNHYLSKVGGIWLKSKEDGIICLITSLNINKNYLYFDCEPYGLDNILDEFCFLDDTPCGKEINIKKENEI